MPPTRPTSLTRRRRPRSRSAGGGKKGGAGAVATAAGAISAAGAPRHTLYARRGLGHFLDAPLHEADVAKETIDAMFRAIEENYALPRRIMKLGAGLEG